MTRFRRLIIGGAVTSAAVLVLFGLFVIRSAGATPASAPVVVDLGDVIQISGTHVTCGVVQRAGVKVLQCLAPPPLAKTYGTLVSDRKVLVIRFRNNTTAKVVFTAVQKRAFSTCKERR